MGGDIAARSVNRGDFNGHSSTQQSPDKPPTTEVAHQATPTDDTNSGASEVEGDNTFVPEESNGTEALQSLMAKAGAAKDEKGKPHDEPERALQLSKLPDEAQLLRRMADKILGCMADVQKEMADYEEYMNSQMDEFKPLYQWERYHGYGAISQVIRALDDAVQAFKDLQVSAKVRLPEDYIKIYRRRGRQFSTSISRAAGFAMGIMREKSETCIDEIEASALTAQGKGEAKTIITRELSKVIKYCVRATSHTWIAFDTLEEYLLAEADDSTPAFLLKRLCEESESRNRCSRKSWLWTAATFAMGAVISAAVGLAAAHLCSPDGFDLAPRTNAHCDGIQAQVLDLVERTHLVTNLTSQLYSIKLNDLGHCHEELSAASESHGLRLDNLAEALGPPNEMGTYYFSSPELDSRGSGNARRPIGSVGTEVEDQMQRLRYDLQMMRRNVNNMDIRLTKRLNRINR